MISKKVQDALNAQINAELASSYLYLSMATYFLAEGHDGMAAWMRAQAQEEYGHAMKIFGHLAERDGRVVLQALPKPKSSWKSPLDAFKAAYAHEKGITGKINKLVDLAAKEKDHATANMLQWFVNEQVEEEASASKIVQMLERIGKAAHVLIMLDRELGKRGAK